MNVNPTLLITLAILSLAALMDSASAKAKNQSGDWDSVSVGQTGLLVRGSKDGISYNEDMSILWGKTVIGQCPYRVDYKEDSRVYVSPTSPKKELFVVLCWEDHRGGKAAWVVDSKNRTVLAKNIVPDRWGIAFWVSWSPNEDFALFHAVGEVTMGDMVFVNLASGRAQEIHYRDFTNNPRIKQNIMDEVQDFDRDGISWINAQTFSLRLDIRCNPYEGDESCLTKVLRSFPARVSLSPFSISYGNTTPARSTRGRRTAPALNSQTGRGIRSVDFRNFTYRREGKSGSNIWQSSVEAKTIVLRKGRNMVKGEYTEGEYGSELNLLRYIDFDGDGKEEAFVVIYTSQEVAGAYWEQDYFVFTYRDGAPIQIFHEYAYKPSGVRITGRSIVIDMPFWRENDPHCCPSAIETSIYRWRGAGFARASRRLKPMPKN